MKYIFSMMALCVWSSTLAGEVREAFTHEDYSQQDLVTARIAWANQEDRLNQLLYEASEISHNKTLEYVSGRTHVASINANDKTITTYLGEGRSVKLSYADFIRLLRDEAIVALANKRLKEDDSKIGWLDYLLRYFKK